METTSQPTTPPSIEDRQTFVIGDVHGHVDRLVALLDKSGAADEHTVIQLGDLGHYGINGGMDDYEAWLFARDHIDYVLWGNHDYAILNKRHAFGGYTPPYPETYRVIRDMMGMDRVRFALAAGGFLLTHAGLAKAFKVQQRVDPAVKVNPLDFAEWAKLCSEMQSPPDAFVGIRDSISVHRGGGATYGGILWRDAREKLYPAFRQIFGHTAKDGKVRCYLNDFGGYDFSYCIDTGTATNGRLAGIWLPSEEIIDIQV